MTDAVIFDLDGTLLNTLEDLKESTNYALLQFAFPIRTLEEVRTFVGNGVRKLIERAVPKNCDTETVEKCLSIFKEHYAKNMYNHTAPYNGILEMLENLHKNNFKIGVVSNKFDAAVKELCKKYFSDLIDIAIGQFDNVPPKPSPEGVLKAMRELDCKNAIYVGDSDVDILTAKNANLPCIGVSWGFRDKETLQDADFIVDNPQSIIKYVL